MDAGQGGVSIELSRGGGSLSIERGMFYPVQYSRRRDPVGQPQDYITLEAETDSSYGYISRELTPTEARQLAAALVALADEIDGGQR